MSGFDLTPEQEDKIYQELLEAEDRDRARRATMTPQFAQTTGQLYRNHPYAPPGLLMSAANAVSSGMMGMEQANGLILNASKNVLTQSVQQKKPEKKSWLERNVMSKVRTAGRWTFAGLNFLPQVATNVASQLFDGQPSSEGFFISTDLGTLMKNDEQAGDGWFMGGRALELQAERARRYRGEIGGHAWTFGRGFASLIAQPNSKPYNILSGLVDAAAQIYIPAVPAPALKGVKGLAAAVEDAAGIRTLAGLTNFENGRIVAEKVGPWLDSKTGQALINKISGIKTMDDALSTFKDVQHMDFINTIVEKSNPAEIRQYLLETLGRPITTAGGVTSYGVSNIDQINISRLDDVKNLVGRTSTLAKMMATVPGRHLVLSGGNPRDVSQSVRNLNNYLKLLYVKPKTAEKYLAKLIESEASDLEINAFKRGLLTPEKADDLVARFSKALVDNNGDVYGVMEQFDEVFDTAMRAMGAPDEAINVFKAGMKDFQKSKDVYGFPEKVDVDFLTTDGKLAKSPFGTAGVEPEMMKQLGMILPDPQRVRRAMSQIGWIFGKGNKLSDPESWRKLRLPLSALHGFQTDIWRPVTLMTGGYVLRNMTESAFRYTMTPGLKGGALHPLTWISVASQKSFRGTLKGIKWSDMDANRLSRVAKEGLDAFDEAVGQTMKETLNHSTIQQRGFKNKVWAIAKRTSGSRYRKGIQDNISLLHDDYVAAKVAEGLLDPQQILDDVVANNPSYLEKLQTRWSNREIEMVGQPGSKEIGTIEFLDDKGKLTQAGKENFKTYVDQYIRRRIDYVTGGDQTLREAIARGDGKFIDLNGDEQDIFKYGRGGQRVGYSDEWTRTVEKIVKEDDARIARGEKGILRDDYKYAIDEKVVEPQDRGEIANWKRSFDKATDWMFGSLYPKRSSYLMQSPVFRQFYWEEVGGFLDELDSAAFQTIGEGLKKAAADEGKTFNKGWLSRYTGNEDLADKLIAKIEKPSSAGKLSLDELDAYAKGVSLDRTKNFFYNAAEKSNFADVMQIIVPFGSAWAETMTAMGKIAMSNPNATRRVGVAVQGLKNADPDGDGKGFFWKDPVTGEYVFNYPFSDTIGGLAAAMIPAGAAFGGILGGLPGIAAGGAIAGAVGFGTQKALGLESTRMIAPVKSMSMALNILPGAGPFVQIGANKILSHFPKMDAVRDAILPYGEPDITTVGPIPVPSWARKVIDGIVSNPDSSRLLGDLTIDVMRVLNASGEYDLSNDDDKLRLEEDAAKRAKALLIFRGLGQFVGPVRPDVEFEVATKQGDKYTVELSKAFREMQTENYDTAVERFINAFGEDAFLYVEGKTIAKNGGLDASTRFGQFERNNGDLFAKYPEVAGYFADVGTNFDYAVYTRQIETGKREKIKPSEYVDLAQQTVGRALYKASQRAIGPNPDDYQKQTLRDIKSLIEARFPGYTKIVVDINKQKGRMKELIRAAGDPILDGNKVAEALRIYLQYRDEALTVLSGRGITSGDLSVKSAADLRATLRSVADTLVQRYPEFERLYDRTLYSEVEGI